MRAKGIKIYLNPNRKEDRRVLDYLCYAGVPYTKAIVDAVSFYLDAQEGTDGNSRLIEQIKIAVRESVQGLQIASVGGVYSSQPSQQELEEPVSMLDFIEALEGGGTSEQM